MDYSNSSSSEDDVSHSSNSTNKRKRQQKHVQSFVDAWLTEKQFKDWLCKRVGKNNTAVAQPFCKVWKGFSDSQQAAAPTLLVGLSVVAGMMPLCSCTVLLYVSMSSISSIYDIVYIISYSC